MKKIILILMCCFIAGCANFSHEEGKLMNISPNEFQSKIDNEDSFILLVTKEDCPYCDNLIKDLQNNIKKYGKNI